MAKIFLFAGFFQIALAGTSSLAEYQTQRHMKDLELRSTIKKLTDLQERRDVTVASGASDQEEGDEEAQCDPDAAIFKEVIKYNREEMINQGSPQKVDSFDGEVLPACGRFQGKDSCCTTLYFKRAVQIMSHQAKMIKDTHDSLQNKFKSIFEQAMENEEDSFHAVVKKTKEELEEKGVTTTLGGFFKECQSDLLRFFSITSCEICATDVEQYLVDESKLKISKEHCEKLHEKCGKYPGKFLKAERDLMKAADKFKDVTTKGDKYLNNPALDSLHGFLKKTSAALKSIATHISNYKEQRDFCSHIASEGYIFRPAWTSSGAFALNGKNRKAKAGSWSNYGSESGSVGANRVDQTYRQIGNKYKKAPKPGSSDFSSYGGMTARLPDVGVEGGGVGGSGGGASEDEIVEDGINGCQNGGKLVSPREGSKPYCRCPVCKTGKRCELDSPAGVPWNQQFSVIYANTPHVFRIRSCKNPDGEDQHQRTSLARIKFITPMSGSFYYHDKRCQDIPYDSAAEHFLFLREEVVTTDKDGFLRYDFTRVPVEAVGMYSVCFCSVWSESNNRCGMGTGKPGDPKWQWAGTVDVEVSPETGIGLEAFQKKIGNTAESRDWSFMSEGLECGYGWLYSRFIGVKVVQKPMKDGGDYLEFECPDDDNNKDYKRRAGPLAMKCVTDGESPAQWYAADSLGGTQWDLPWKIWDGQVPECSWKYLECRQPLNFLENGELTSYEGLAEYTCKEGHTIFIHEKWYGKKWFKMCAQGGPGGDFAWKCSKDNMNWQPSTERICQAEPKCKEIPKPKKCDSVE